MRKANRTAVFLKIAVLFFEWKTARYIFADAAIWMECL